MTDSFTVTPVRSAGFELVLTTPAQLEDEFLARIGQVRGKTVLAPIDVLVGGVLQRPYLQRLIADTSPGLLNIRFSTLGELGIRLGERALIDAGRRPLPAMAARGFAAEIARGTAGYFGPVAHTPGFAEAIRRLVGELRQENVSLELLERLAPAIAESETKSTSLVDVYRRYLEGRADRYDGSDALAVADPLLFDGTELLVYGIWRLGALGRRLLERLADLVSITVYLPTVGSDADVAHRELREWLATRGATEVAVGPVAREPTALTHLQATLFAPAAPVEPDGTVQLVSAPDPLSEVREAARTCLDWAREGILFREIAITYRDAATYRPVVEAVFTKAGIPVYLDDGPSIAGGGRGRAASRTPVAIRTLTSRTTPAPASGYAATSRLPRCPFRTGRPSAVTLIRIRSFPTRPHRERTPRPEGATKQVLSRGSGNRGSGGVRSRSVQPRSGRVGIEEGNADHNRTAQTDNAAYPGHLPAPKRYRPRCAGRVGCFRDHRPLAVAEDEMEVAVSLPTDQDDPCDNPEDVPLERQPDVRQHGRGRQTGQRSDC